ncbi:MAG: thiol-disulfide oxidoreductase DCC family protein [Limisphaerales bacterium]
MVLTGSLGYMEENKQMHEHQSTAADSMFDDCTIHGWVLYDESCGFCQRWVPFWRLTLRKRGFAIAPLQATWVQEKLSVSSQDLLKDLRLLLRDGRQIQGADVYRYVTRRIWWAFPVYLFSVTPVFRRLFDVGYRTFANNRYCISGKCGLQKS